MDSDSVQLNVQGEIPRKAEKKGISGSTIKIIAVAAMLIDHIGAVIMARQLMAEGLGSIFTSNDAAKVMAWLMDHALLYYGYIGIRAIGRLGFPIFCFLLVEGFQKTKNVRKYVLRMGLFALISEIPFNLAVTGKVMEFGYQNVYFTLFLGLFTLCAYEFLARYRQTGPESRWWTLSVVLGTLFTAMYGTTYVKKLTGISSTESLLASLGVFCVIAAVCLMLYGRKRGRKRLQVAGADMTVLVLAMYLADFLNTDYAGMGVLTITAMYIFRKRKVLSVTAGCVVLSIMSISEIPAFLTLIPIALYNGKRGLKMKYFFYAFYPMHLFLLYLAAVLLGLGDVAIF